MLGGRVQKAAPSRRRTVESRAVQTEASFPPDCVDMEDHFKEYASEQFRDLCRLRDVIRAAMKEVACSVYDVVAFKDVLFKIEEKLPLNFPVTDMLLLSSKLFRRTAELGRLLGCFFGVVFAEGHVDESFHFTELRILRQELVDVKRRFAQAEEERVRLQRMLDDVGGVAMNHSRALELLETRNTALQLQTSGLEDQMALLFSQLNEDLYHRCKDAYERLSGELDNQDRMSLTKATFRQTMESLSDQLRHSRTLINDVRVLIMSCAQNSTVGGRNVDAQISKEPSIRFKLKQVENNFQQLVSRFSAVKNVVNETAFELMGAMQERRNVLYLSLQHIRLYDLQNAKMRQSKATLFDMKSMVEELVKRMGITFPTGAIAFVDRIGRISTQQWQVGQTLAAIRHQKAGDHVSEDVAAVGSMKASPAVPQSSTSSHGREQQPKLKQQQQQQQQHKAGDIEMVGDERFSGSISDLNIHDEKGNVNAPFQTIVTIMDLVKRLGIAMENLGTTLNFENELNAFLRAITLSLSTTPREMDGTLDNFTDEAEAVERALIPTGSIPNRPRYFTDSSRQMYKTSDAHHSPTERSPERAERSQSMGCSQDSLPSSEHRRRVQRLQEQLDSVRPEFAAKVGLLRQVYESRIWDLEMKESSIHRKLNALAIQEENEQNEAKAQSARGDRDNKSTLLQQPKRGEKAKTGTQKERLARSRADWKKVMPTLRANRPTRVATLNEISKMSRGASPTEEVVPSGNTEQKQVTQNGNGGSSKSGASSTGK